MKTLNFYKTFIGILLFFLILIGPVLMISFDKYYYLDYSSKANFSTISRENATQMILKTRLYLLHKADLPDAFTKNEKLHMVNVREIFDALLWIFTINLFFFIILLAYLRFRRKDFSFLKSPARFSSIAVLCFSLLIIILVLTNFTSTFTYFHEVFFPQGNWVFPQGSVLVTIFNEKFFSATASLMFATIILISASILSITFMTLQKKKQ